MAKLKTEHKELIIRELACYKSPSEIQELVKEDYNIEVSTPQIAFYNPETAASKNLSEKWRAQFRNIRQQYKEEISRHDIAAKGYRLGMLQKQLKKMDRAGNVGMVLQILEQAAKEVGGAYEGKDPDVGEGITVNNYIQQVYNKIEGK